MNCEVWVERGAWSVDSSVGNVDWGVQSVEYEMVLGSALCKIFGTKYHLECLVQVL